MSNKNGAPFAPDEFSARQSRVRARMERRGLDAIFVTDEAEIAYLTGYAGRSAYVPQLLLLDGTGDPLLFLREMDAPAALHTTCLEADQVRSYGESSIGDPDASPYSAIFDMLATRLAGTRRIGAAKAAIAAVDWPLFETAVGPDRLTDSGALVSWERLIKSPAELKTMREAAAISDAAMTVAAQTIRPGVRECDAAAAISAALIKGLPHAGGEDIHPPLMPSAVRTGAAHLHWTDAPYRRGDWVNLELGGVRHRYTAGLMRTFSLGPPSDELARLHTASIEGLEQAMDAIRPGTPCEEVARAFNATVARHGFEKRSRCGYSIGIGWLEPTISLRIGDRTPLRPSMTLHLMLGMWCEPTFGHVLSETVLVTESGCESLTRAARDLVIVE